MQIPEHLKADYHRFQEQGQIPGTPEHKRMEEAFESILQSNPLTGKPVAPKSAAAARRARKLGLPFVLRLN